MSRVINTDIRLKQIALEGVNGLRKWCEEKTGHTITDFDESWRDGMFYARIVARHRPSLINLKSLETMPLDKRLDTIFTVFEEKLDLFAIFTTPEHKQRFHFARH